MTSAHRRRVEAAMVPYVYDTGVLIAIDRRDETMWAIHTLAQREKRRVFLPAVVVGQAWRDVRRQVLLHRFIDTCEVVSAGIAESTAAGVLCGQAGTRDVVDALVAGLALVHGGIIWTSDPQDLATLVAASGARPAVPVRRVSIT